MKKEEKIEKMAEILGNEEKAKEIYEILTEIVKYISEKESLGKKIKRIMNEKGVDAGKTEDILEVFFDIEPITIDDLVPDIREVSKVWDNDRYKGAIKLVSISRNDEAYRKLDFLEKLAEPPENMYRGPEDSSLFAEIHFEGLDPEIEKNIVEESAPILEKIREGGISSEEGFFEILNILNSKIAENIESSPLPEKRFKPEMSTPLKNMVRMAIERGHKVDAFRIVKETVDFFASLVDKKIKELENAEDNIEELMEELNSYLSIMEDTIEEAMKAYK